MTSAYSGRPREPKKRKPRTITYSERAYSSWERTVLLPVKVKSEVVKAKYQDGILEVALPRTEEAKRKRKEIKIE